MNITRAGLVSVPSSGTPVPLSTDPKARATHIFFQAAPGLTGKMYIGTPSMNISTLAGVARVLAPNPSSAAGADCWDLEAHADEDSLYLNQLAIDAAVSGEGLIVSAWTE